MAGPGSKRDIASLLAKLGWTPQAQRRTELPVSPIGEAARRAEPVQVLKIRGRVVAPERGTLVAPFTGRAVVAARAQYLKRSVVHGESSIGVRGPSAEEWNAELDERGAVEFWVDDGTGRAFVSIEGADVTAPLAEVSVPAAMNAAANAFLDERGVIRAQAHFGAKLLEAVVAPGDLVEVVGPARRESIEHGAGYRDLALPSLVFFASDGAEGALTVHKLA